jgi:hypothetical protein
MIAFLMWQQAVALTIGYNVMLYKEMTKYMPPPVKK